ncbi:hypothetical protein RJ640_017095 [Escallonia rubra]|uniref:DYW domain-containing protein n=1 Tax=Escallonia rubra TaxID=112253 RepID=A0AA88U8P8_9ASTE|nr:hypothetical protein RJ640_017095 [Escallonia rubra]
MEITTMAEAVQLHAQILKSGYHDQTHAQNLSKLFTFSALSPLGNPTYARLILNSLHTPNSYYSNTMIRAYSDSRDPTQSISLFLSMHHQQRVDTPRPDKFTYPFVLKACSKLRLTHLGKMLHGLICKLGFESDQYIQNAMIHMYSGCGQSRDARKVFDKMSGRDVVSWTSIIDGFVDNDRPIEAITLFEQMVEDGVDPNEATLVSVLRACADTGALGVGMKVNKIVEEKKLGSQANVSTALIDMYSKCGCLDSALRIFDETFNKDVFAWTAMISGLASHGRSKDAIFLFDQMTKLDLEPDERTITAVLSACRNAGWVHEGLSYFKNMRKKYKVRPAIQHYGCVVDLLARAGHLEDAEEFIRKMPIEPDAILWRTLISACKIHGETNRGDRLTKCLDLLQMNSSDCGSYVLLSNVYASEGRWHDKARMRDLMNKKGLLKPPGSSRIELSEVVHEFTAGDSGHPEAEKIYRKLDEMEESLRRQGYNPKLSEVLLEIDDVEKASQLLHHSEKLAVSFGLIKKIPGTIIRIVKNLRSCEDCHSFMKLASKIYHREIVIRDRIRFHYFKNGECSCGDYW